MNEQATAAQAVAQAVATESVPVVVPAGATKPATPNLDKFNARRAEVPALVEFVAHLYGQGMTFFKTQPGQPDALPLELICGFFGVDYDALQVESAAALEFLKQVHSATHGQPISAAPFVGSSQKSGE